MSDVERPSGNGHSQHERTPPPPPAARNMADIARLFLDGARPPSTPRRSPTPPAPTPPRPTPITAKTPAPSPSGNSVILALAHRPDDAAAWRLLSAAAAGLAHEHSTTVALVGFATEGRGTNFILDIHGAETPADLPPIARSTVAADLQIARVLHNLRDTVGLWLVIAPEPESHHFGAISAILSDWLLVCPTDNTGLLATYHLLKRASVKSRQNIPPLQTTPATFLVADDSARAAGVHQRLRTAAQEFLKTDLRFAGTGPASAQPAVRMMTLPITGPLDAAWAGILDELCPLAESENGGAESAAPHPFAYAPPPTPKPPEPRPVLQSPTSRVLPPPQMASTSASDIDTALDHLAATANDIQQSSARAASMMLDHLAQVLDPEEREALTAAFEDLPETETELPASQSATTQVAAPARRAATTMEAPRKSEPKPEPGVTLRAFDLLESHERTRASQWQAVERSIRDLVPDSVLLEARPPMSWAIDSCIAIDPAGRLHVWTLYKDGTSWFALREWASEHRKLLGLTRRESTICQESPVVVHIVLPLEDAPTAAGATTPNTDASVVNTILRTPAKNIHIYRLRVLQWESRRGMVVVPIA